MIGFAGNDDAAVYRLDDERALVLTADIITPPVDDARVFGAVAAANALSDVYAMGGRPLVCLNLVAFPQGRIDDTVLHEMMLGAADKVVEAGAVIAGGHTIRDEEPKFGLSVTGIVHPSRIWRNTGARPGDALVLTKPIGSGVILNANLEGAVSEAALGVCLRSMMRLNRTSAEVALSMEIHSATDVTGFGLLGHLLEMARPDGLQVRLDRRSIPRFPEALELYQSGFSTGSNEPNRALVSVFLRGATEVPRPWMELMVDPQTSGGLLFALAEDQAAQLVDGLHNAGVEDACIIGTVVDASGEAAIEIN